MPSAEDSIKRDPIKPWFKAVESTGEFIGIRFGRLAPGAREPEWIYLPHSEYDGIGGFAHLLRKAGAPIELPKITPHSASKSLRPFLRSLPRLLGPRRRPAWNDLPPGKTDADPEQPAPAAAWHVFSRDDTAALLEQSRAQDVTLNSYLLKHLDTAVRSALAVRDGVVPWMVPVNLRGAVDRGRDTANHTSYVAIGTAADDSVRGVHSRIRQALARGEHWANWTGYSLGHVFPEAVKRHLIRTGRALSQWNVGGFSNLGTWDPQGAVTHKSVAGSWLFCPPVLRCQMIGAGCMTFQGRLSLLIQAHAELTTDPDVPRGWMRQWLAGLQPMPDSGDDPAAIAGKADALHRRSDASASPVPRASGPAAIS